jgi:hypothetical protein
VLDGLSSIITPALLARMFHKPAKVAQS